jgi:hypothetical protein
MNSHRIILIVVVLAIFSAPTLSQEPRERLPKTSFERFPARAYGGPVKMPRACTGTLTEIGETNLISG